MRTVALHAATLLAVLALIPLDRACAQEVFRPQVGERPQDGLPSIDLPVPTRNIRVGEILTSADLEFTRWTTAGAAGFVTDYDLIVGKEARRALAKGRPVRPADVGAPFAVRRNDAVTMAYRNGALDLAVLGKALDAGAEGDTIRVVNSASRRTVQAVIIGPGAVSVAP
jgi:flagella basal body P-ring formation protein FlgA